MSKNYRFNRYMNEADLSNTIDIVMYTGISDVMLRAERFHAYIDGTTKKFPSIEEAQTFFNMHYSNNINELLTAMRID